MTDPARGRSLAEDLLAQEPGSPSGADPDGALPSSDRGRRGPIVAVVGVTALALVGGLVGYLVHRSNDTSSPPTAARTHPVAAAPPTPTATLNELTDWLVDNVRTGVRISTDPATTAALRQLSRSQPRGGLVLNRVGGQVDTVTGSWKQSGYVLSTPTLRAAASRSGVDAAALASSVPVASFGPTTGRVEVRQVVSDPAAAQQVSVLRHDDADTRRQAGTQLLSNHGIAVAAQPRAQLLAGRLDLRAAVVLAVLADSGPVQLTAVVADPAEAAVGLPARSIRIEGAALAELPGLVKTLGAQYRPNSPRHESDGSWLVSWPLASTPVAPIG
jgi:hypothetical protein